MGLAEKTFLDKSDKKYFYKRKKVQQVLKLKNKPYKLEIKHLNEMFERCYSESLDEFAMNYCFGYFMIRPHLDTTILREAMYLEIMAYYNEHGVPNGNKCIVNC